MPVSSRQWAPHFACRRLRQPDCRAIGSQFARPTVFSGVFTAIMSNRRVQLHQATASAHRQLDALMGEMRGIADYRRYLAALTSARLAVEPLLSVAVPMDTDYAPTLLADSLKLDCRDIGALEPEYSGARLPPVNLTGDGWLGAAYVFEGSMLGAPLLMRAAQSFGLGACFGARHLGKQLTSRSAWTALLEQLEGREAVDMPRAIDAALGVFAVVEAAARSASHER
jgi:heme oxygenase (biliverdin-IX-beta and delta-forming)